jgi:hypothetical protein
VRLSYPRDVRAKDELTRRFSELLEGTYDWVDRVVLNAYMPVCHSPGGFRYWWRAWHNGNDQELDDTALEHCRLEQRWPRRQTTKTMVQSA